MTISIISCLTSLTLEMIFMQNNYDEDDSENGVLGYRLAQNKYMVYKPIQPEF